MGCHLQAADLEVDACFPDTPARSHTLVQELAGYVLLPIVITATELAGGCYLRVVQFPLVLYSTIVAKRRRRSDMGLARSHTAAGHLMSTLNGMGEFSLRSVHVPSYSVRSRDLDRHHLADWPNVDIPMMRGKGKGGL